MESPVLKTHSTRLEYQSSTASLNDVRPLSEVANINYIKRIKRNRSSRGSANKENAASTHRGEACDNPSSTLKRGDVSALRFSGTQQWIWAGQLDERDNCQVSQTNSRYSYRRKSKHFDGTSFHDRTVKWKQEKEERLRKKRTQKDINSIQNCTFTPLLERKKDFTQVTAIESICPTINASKIERRSKMRLSLSKKRKLSAKISKTNTESHTKSYASLKGTW